MSRKWIVIIAVLAVDLVIAVTVAAIVLDRERDEARRAAAIAATSTTNITSPYDFTELTDDVDLDLIDEASFVSILVPDESGELTSYGVSMELPTARALADAVRQAEEVDPETAAAMTGGTAVSTDANRADSTGGEDMTGAAITFVLPSRETVTFIVDLDQDLIAREGRAWRVDGDLRGLVERATTGPT